MCAPTRASLWILGGNFPPPPHVDNPVYQQAFQARYPILP